MRPPITSRASRHSLVSDGARAAGTPPVDGAAASAGRLDYIDWLRLLAVTLLLPYHSARVFDIFDTFYVKNAVLSGGLSAIIAFLDPWHMPFFFVLAGMSTCLALRRRSGGQYLCERLRRLLVPLVFGILVIVPPQAYLARVTHAGYSGSYLQFYPTFFQIQPGDLTGYTGDFTPAHLWFILFLFVFSIVALPLFLWLRSERGQTVVARGFAVFRYPCAIFLLILPLGVTDGLLPDFGGKNPFFYLMLFLYGYLLVASEQLQRAVDRHRWWALALALLTSAVTLVAAALDLNPARFSAADIALFFARMTSAWCWTIALLGLGRRYLIASRLPGPLLGYAREASYSIYILHQTVIVAIAFVVVGWDTSVAIKYVAILVAASAGTLLIYEFLVRRLRPARFLFGMKTARSEKPLFRHSGAAADHA
jgi:peptidoglycan/LPS O-acetylase OafA/YrhL